jgi:hypothetical protein
VLKSCIGLKCKYKEKEGGHQLNTNGREKKYLNCYDVQVFLITGKDKKVKISLLQAVEAHRVARG